MLFRYPPKTNEELAKQLKDFIVYTESELHELLRTVQWKGHRKLRVDLNKPHMLEECADILKCVISLFQICGFTPEQLVNAYWDKSAVCRQRYAEEWQKNLGAPCAIVDIDNVICDYITGICNWLMIIAEFDETIDVDVVEHVRDNKLWVNADSLKMPEARWKRLKHEFRITSRKRMLPVLSGAVEALTRLKEQDLQIVLLTSRPIDRYPNIYTDTLLWLQHHDVPFDFILWGHDKVERILESDLRDHVKLTVDDDRRYAEHYAQLGLSSYWVTQQHPETSTSHLHPVPSLAAAVNDYLSRSASRG